jgi:hypothetical protein
VLRRLTLSVSIISIKIHTGWLSSITGIVLIARVATALVPSGGTSGGTASSASDHRLQRGEPKRQIAAMVLDENADEALEQAEHGTVEHHRRHLVRVLVNIEGAETTGHVEIDLHGAALPVATYGVAQHVFELWPIEAPSPLLRVHGRPEVLSACINAALDLSHTASSPMLVGAVGEFNRDVGGAEICVIERIRSFMARASAAICLP